jgi:hypothetical protein
MNFLTNRKTYIVCIVAILYALFQRYFSNAIDNVTMVQIILAALGAAGLRNAIK